MWWECFRSILLPSFKYYNTVLLAIITLGYTRRPELIYLITRSLYFLINISLCASVLSCFSCVWLFVTLWTVAHQAPLSIGFSRQEYWGGLPFLLQGPSWPRIEPASPMSPAFAVRFFTANTTWESHLVTLVRHKQRYWANCIPWLWSNNSHASCQVTLGRTFFIKEQYDGFQLLLHLGEWQLHRLKSNYW